LAPELLPKQPVRPTKKQQELLTYIADFIKEHGYSPSYREIMAGLNYNSVATVSLHVNSLIKRGHLVKRDHSARSLEVVDAPSAAATVLTNEVSPAEEKWLVDKVEHAFREVEQSSVRTPQDIDNLYVLVGALKVLGLDGASLSFQPRLKQLKP
jgi:SOS-response transcriptional repressor LexA